MLLKQKALSLPRNLTLVTSGELIIVFSTKVNLLSPLYSVAWRGCLLHLIKQNCLLKTFLRTRILITQVCLNLTSGTSLKLHDVSLTPKVVKKVITNCGLSNASGLDCITVVFLKNCEPDLSYMLAELFNMCLKKSYFPDCWKVPSMFPVF